MITKRMKIAAITGAFLGVICIIGIAFRMGVRGNSMFLIAMWYNRLLMGIVIGLAASWLDGKSILRGLLLGLLVSGAFYLTTEFRDMIGFLAGPVYGIIIDFFATRYG